MRIILRYSIILIAVFILVSLIYPFLPIKPTIPCANSISCSESLKLKIENNAIGIFNNRRVIPPKIYLSIKDTQPGILGTETDLGEKHIYVNLTKQKLYAYQGNTLFMETFISSGKWAPTPTGNFKIWIKVRATRMTGGSGDDYYDLPNVPFVMFFANNEVAESRGFSLHGTYWHNNFGHPMSHGCVNMRITDAKKLYDWLNPLSGTTVTIYGQAPI